MPNTSKRKLKTFQAQFGFYDTVVAAPSQTAALRAWGTHQNLFATGQARLITDQATIAAASKHAGTPLRRAVGSAAPFGLEPTALPQLPDEPKRSRRIKSKPLQQPTRRSKPAPPDRSKLDAAEAAIRKLDDRRKAKEADLQREQDKLDARRSSAKVAYVKARKEAAAEAAAARKAYREAGGTG